MVRVIRFPIFIVINMLIGSVLVFYFLAWVSVGDWCEDGLRWLGYRGRPDWLPGAVGIAVYTSLGVVGPAYLGYSLIGWPGAIIGPIVSLILIAVLGRW